MMVMKHLENGVKSLTMLQNQQRCFRKCPSFGLIIEKKWMYSSGFAMSLGSKNGLHRKKPGLLQSS